MIGMLEFIDGGPGCMRDDCMIAISSGVQTLTHYPTHYNSNGVNINPDMNITYENKRCLSCGKGWTEKWQNGIKIGSE